MSELISAVPILDRQKYFNVVQNCLLSDRKIDLTPFNHIDWLILRTFGIGGSDVAAVLGINKYQTPFQVWQSKTADEVKIIENDVMIFGNIIEPAILEMYYRKTGIRVVKDQYMRFHPEFGSLYVNLDGVLIEDSQIKKIVECKSTVSQVYKKWQTDEEDCVQGIPLYMFCQIQHEMSITGLPEVDLAILITDQRRLEIRTIKRDDEYIAKQNEALNRWYDAYVLQMVPPEMTAKEFALVTPIIGSFIEANPEIMNALDELKKRKELSKGLGNEIENIENQIKEFFGDNENITFGGSVVATWKQQKKTTVDSKLLKELYPDVAKATEKISEYRVLRLK